MSMFCYQCQEAAKNVGCDFRGVCGKSEDVSNLQDLLIYLLKGISIYAHKAEELGVKNEKTAKFVVEGLFATITNVNFDDERFLKLIDEAFEIRKDIKRQFEKAYYEKYGKEFNNKLSEETSWYSNNPEEYYQKAEEVGILSTGNKDIRSLRELLIYGLKGIAAYTEHAYILNQKDNDIFSFIFKGLAATTDDNLNINDLVGLVMECGKLAVKTMALLDKANTESYGDPEPTRINIGVKTRPGILVSGHDLKDLEELLEQTKGRGIDIYTHGEMLPANSYPFFKRYDHFIGNYGNAWWEQSVEFEKFNGPILMTTNCLVPPRKTYKERVYTTGIVGFPGVKHIPDRVDRNQKNFSKIIEHALNCKAPEELENGTISGGFAHKTLTSLADRIIEAVKKGNIKRFIVMAGCDGRQKGRDYYSEIASKLPEDAIILTAGCAKFRYNKLDLGEIEDIPRILDAGQCNDSYSLVVIAQKLAEAFGVNDINELPISYDIAWYEQKAVAVLLALLYLGVKGIRLGPSLPPFLSPNVMRVLVEKFDIKPIGTVEEDIKAIMVGE